MIRRLTFIALCLILSACGTGGTATTDAPPGSPPPPPPPGTSETQVLVEVALGEDPATVVGDAGGVLIGPVAGTAFYLVEIPAGVTVAEFISSLEDDGRVLQSEEDVGLSAPEGGGATLPFGGDDLTVDIGRQPELLRIGLLQAHARTTGLGVRIAVIDTGVLPTHPLLVGHIGLGGRDFVDGDLDPTDMPNGADDDGDGLIDEGYGHGTFVASLILAVAPDATIVPFRVLNSDSVGSASTLAEAISAAVAIGVDVINISAGMDLKAEVVKQAVANAERFEVAVITSTGNTGIQDVTFPATLSKAFSVTAVDSADRKADFASFGDDVDFAAPGVALIGAFPNPSGTARWSGTSFSAAIVSGAFALVRAAFPLLKADDVARRLRDTTVDIDPLNPLYLDLMGRGRLDLNAATAP